MSKQHPEEDDEFDDLDDLLDDFADEVLSKPPGAAIDEKPASSTTTTTAPDSSANQPAISQAEVKDSPKEKQPVLDEDPDADPELSMPELDEQFANKLKLGLDYLLNDMSDSPEAKQEFESLMSGLAGATATGAAPASTTKPASTTSTGAKGGFQDTISQTMDRLKESNKDMNSKASNPDDDFMARMMKEFEQASGGGGGGSGEGGDMGGLLAEMLQELSSKEILYEPLKEMQTKFPDWFAKHESTANKDDLARYKQQFKLINEMCDKFEDPKYSDSDNESRQYIADRMEEMQKSGSPPSELVGGLANGAIPGMEFGQDGLPANMPENMEDCNVQ